MKKIYTLLCIAATMLAACAKENLVENDATPQDEEVKYIDVTFGAEFPVPAELQDNAKTMLNSDWSVSWCEGDNIGVMTDKDRASSGFNKDFIKFTGTVQKDDDTHAQFSGSIDNKSSYFIAIYPYSCAVEDHTVTVWGGYDYMNLPNSQVSAPGSFANNCALAYANGTVSNGKIQENIQFTNLCSLLEFTMPSYVVGAKSVVIRSNDGTKMSGGCRIERDGDFNLKTFERSDSRSSLYDYVTITSPEAASKFYAVIFPGSYSKGLTITVTTENGQTYSLNVSKPLNAQANHIYNLGTLGIVLDEGKVDLSVNIEQDIKTGSVATFNIAAKDDFKTMIKNWDINLYNSKGELVRKIEGNTTGSGTLDVVGDYKLLAAGDYYATVTYFRQTDSETSKAKRAPLNFTGFKAPQFKVEGVVINATPTLNYDGGSLNGTDVQLSFDTSAVDPDLAKLINWTEIKLADASGVTYRTATAAGKMTPASGKPYMPKGTYTLTAYFTLPDLGCNDPTPLDPKTISTENLTPTFGVSLTSAKTSYDYYKAGSVSTANGCSNMGIYELAAKVTGISDAVATQMAGHFTYEWFLDNNSIGKTENTNATVSGISQNTNNAVKVAFGNKNVKCKTTFDGIVKESGNNIAVDITGLPYNPNNEGMANYASDWSVSGGSSKKEDGCFFLRNNATATFKGFHIPANVNTTVSYYIEGYVASRFNDHTTVFTAAGINIVNEKISGTGKWTEYKSTKDITFTTSQKTMTLSSNGNSSSWATAQVKAHRISVTYR